MIAKLLAAITGSTAEGQRKMAMGVYTIGLLFLLAGGALIGTWVAGGVDAGRPHLLRDICEQAITAIGAAFGLLIVGNGVEHVAGAIKAKGQ